MFKFLKNLFKSNDPEIIKHLYKLKNFDLTRNNFRFRHDEYGRFVAIDLVDDKFALNILKLDYEFGHHYSKFTYQSGVWDKHLIETIDEIHKEWLNKEREKTIADSLIKIKNIEHFEKLFEGK